MMQLAMYKGPPNGWGRRFMHAAICLGTKSRYSHCEILVNGVGHTSSRADGGIRAKPLDLGTNHWDLYSLEQDEARVLAWFTAHMGQPYDTACEWKFLTGNLTPTRGHWWCSQACAAALGLDEPWELSPQQLLEKRNG